MSATDSDALKYQIAPEISLAEAIKSAGLIINETPIADGTIHRFNGNGGRSKDSYYVLNMGPQPWGAYGDFKLDLHRTWCAKTTLSPAEKRSQQEQIARARAAYEREKLTKHERAKATAQKIWNSAGPAPDDHIYLDAKGVKSYGLRVHNGRLVVPLRNTQGELWSLEFITGNGKKRFLPNGKKRGLFFPIEGEGDVVYLVEGYSTGASVHEATGATVIVAFDAGNLLLVAQEYRAIHPNTPLVFAADNDAWRDDGNTGIKKAKAAAQAVSAGVAVPQFGDVSTLPTDWNDLHQLEGLEVVRAQLETKATRTEGRPRVEIITGAELAAKDFPEIRWTVDGIVPEGAALLAGKPKMGKSWLALNMGVAVASGNKALGGLACERGAVLYLALEDNQRRLKKRQEKIVAGGTAPEKLHFATQWRRIDNGGLDDIAQWIASHDDARLVIVDTLEKIRGRRRGSDVYAEDYFTIGQLKALADEHFISVVIVTHLRKASADDPIDEISGSTGITGAADAIMILKRDRLQGGCASLFVTGRDIENEADLAVKFDESLGLWSIAGEGDEYRMTPERRDVIELIKINGPAMIRQLSEAMGKEYEATKSLIRRMVDDGQLQRVPKWRYDLHWGLGGPEPS